MMMKDCPICLKQLIPDSIDTNPVAEFGGSYRFNCQECGNYLMPHTAYVKVESNLFKKDPKALFKVRRAIKLTSLQGDIINLTSETIKAVLNNPLPSINQQADLLIRLIGDKSKRPGSDALVNADNENLIIGAPTTKGFLWIVEHLIETQHIKISSGRMGTKINLILTFKGWNHFEELKKGGHTYNQAFMAMKFGDSDLDRIVNEVFKPAVSNTGFDLIRLDDRPKAGLIDDRLRVEIQSSDILIADLTHDNLGAYWEAGYAEGLGKPVIYTCKKSKFEETKTHFDTNHHLTVIWNPDDPQEAGEQLKATIRATLPGVAIMRDLNK